LDVYYFDALVHSRELVADLNYSKWGHKSWCPKCYFL